MDELALSPEMMLSFYNRLYPFKSIFNWLNHEPIPTRLFTHREFSFTLAGDVYLRYHSFNNVEDLKKQICVLNPTRFEIGPVYSARPRDKKTVRPGLFNPVLRELVFDIDMTDYDPVRTCCTGADICKKCWGFIGAAVKVIDQAVRTEFGYEKLLWVYSGRRGIHLWISDKEAMELTDPQRKALVGWLTVIHGGKESSKRLNVRNAGRLPPSLQQALDYLRTVFGQLILATQDCFRDEKGWEELLKAIPEPRLVDQLRSKWEDDPSLSSQEKWSELLGHRSSYKSLPSALEDIILQYTYPRLDAEVSKHRNHLLKAPFCVHPKTGRVCVPVDAEAIDRFDPASVPTVGQLLQELDAIPREQGEPRDHHSDWEKTSLKPYIEFLDRHAQGLMAETRKEKRNAGDMTW